MKIDSLSCLKMSIDHIRAAFKYGLIKTQKTWLTSNSISVFLCVFLLNINAVCHPHKIKLNIIMRISAFADAKANAQVS